MKGERKKGGQWPVNRMTTGSGLPKTVPALTLESHIIAFPSRPGQTGHPHWASLTLEWGLWERQKRVFWGSQGKKSISSQSPWVGSACPRAASYSSTSCSHCPSLVLLWPDGGPVQRASGGGCAALRASKVLPEPERAGAGQAVCGGRLRPEDDWASPSICCERKSFFPASPASACPSPAVRDQLIHHPDWCSPPSIFLLPLLSTLVLSSADFFQHLRWALQQLGWLITVASRFRGGAGSTCFPQTAESSAFLLLSLRSGGSCTEELEGEGRQLF